MDVGIEEPRALYQKRIPIVTRSVKGRFRNFKWGVMVLAYAVFFGLPWLPWTRHGVASQAVMFDLGGRRFFIFDLVMYPQNVFWLALLLFIAATFLFFATSLIGRAFCGYFCFQTLWTDIFIWIEKLVQGERPARIRLQRQPWDREKILKLGVTHALWLLISFWTGMTFMLYYGYAPDLLVRFFTGHAAYAAYVTVFALTATTYAAAGLMREQICAYVCPYGRFQSVMYDPETLAVAYDARRGDGSMGRAAPRAELKIHAIRQQKGYGDCIDCGFCVQVCPAGIDIRDGLQYRCISCGLCIDACNNIMDSVGYPRGLIRYDSEANLALPQPAKPHIHWKRLKVVGYFVALGVMTGALVYSIATRTNFEHDVQQIRQPLYVVLSNGDIRNRYQIRLTNKSGADMEYRITTQGLPPGALDLGEMQTVKVHSGNSVIVQASIKLTPQQVGKYPRFDFVITPLSAPEDKVVEQVNFYSRTDEQ
ncbi:protein RdxB [Sulfuriferula plumbiphila]|uniref:Protein RdxB n=1 Tax=Sulfuriferula plumbiphila TaxID=171865 RepID=A0A512L732_9PROT|nr:cytochrome c oxidase accessory protein CcoG [Sulfuriferula plumbiphila]BBP02871.1 protein RdxB [Sulfuriferula plumbiphila]GEP30262.1 protein RdxB [Sulfuriferula plumbiphila]